MSVRMIEADFYQVRWRKVEDGELSSTPLMLAHTMDSLTPLSEVAAIAEVWLQDEGWLESITDMGIGIIVLPNNGVQPTAEAAHCEGLAADPITVRQPAAADA